MISREKILGVRILSDFRLVSSRASFSATRKRLASPSACPPVQA